MRNVMWVTAVAAALGGCSGMWMSAPEVPPAIAVPAGNKPVMTLKGVGQLAYECRAKAGAAGAYEWAFAGPDAVLQDSRGNQVGKYYGGPTWEHRDGSKLGGKQLAVSPGGAGNIPLQLVQANPVSGIGAFAGVTYIQRVNTAGGVVPPAPCDEASIGSKRTVGYSADYVFFKGA
jgi:Protein of unknown function (DUF3455)